MVDCDLIDDDIFDVKHGDKNMQNVYFYKRLKKNYISLFIISELFAAFNISISINN